MRVFSMCGWFIVLLEGCTAQSVPGKWCQCGHVRSRRGGHSARPRITKLHPSAPEWRRCVQRDRHRDRGPWTWTWMWTVGSPLPACLPACHALTGVAWPAWRPETWRVLLACLHGGSVLYVQRRGGTLQRGCGKARQDLSRARVVWYRGSSTVCAQGYAYFATRIYSHCNGATTRGRRLRRTWRGQIWSLF